MYKLLIGAAAAALVTLSPAVAATAQPQPNRQGAHDGHHRGMMNKTMARTEVQGEVSKMFARVDANKDGFISTAEIDSLEARKADRIEAKMQQRVAHFDPAKAFSRLDSNKDGKLTKAEVEAARAGRKGAAAKGHGADQLFARADGNKDGIVTLAEMQAMPKPTINKAEIEKRAGAGKAHMMGVADTNKDGMVSLAEAQQAALARFDRADLDKDGKVTPQERAQSHQAMRKPG